MSTGKWWLVSWRTYGSWLPGDPRGFKTWRGRRYIPQPANEGRAGEPVYDAEDYATEYDLAKRLVGDVISLSPEERKMVDEALAADLEKLTLVPAIQSVAAQHIHLLAKFGSLRIRPTVGRLKFAATQKLHECGIASLRIWAKGEHMESLPIEQAFLNAFEYVRRHEDEGAVVRIFRMEYAEDSLPF